MSKESYNIQDFLRIFGVNYSPVSIKHPPALNSVIRDRAVILDMVKHLNLRRRSTLICKGIVSERFDWNMKIIFTEINGNINVDGGRTRHPSHGSDNGRLNGWFIPFVIKTGYTVITYAITLKLKALTTKISYCKTRVN